MNDTDDEELLVKQMSPGALCREGFLGNDTRPLQEIVRADAAAVEKLGLTHEQIARRLGEVLQAATAAMGRPVNITETLSTCYRESMGRIPCPWSRCGLFRKGEAEVTDSRTGGTVRLTPLSVHMIGRHGFYQGRGSRYRLKPAEIAQLLDIRPDNE